ncbi:MAG: hypothetical protein AAGH60_12220, partial [Pseudomonadota bacterium]
VGAAGGVGLLAGALAFGFSLWALLVAALGITFGIVFFQKLSRPALADPSKAAMNQSAAPGLINAFTDKARALGINKPKFALLVEDSAALLVDPSSVGKKSLNVRIGLSLLKTLSNEQLANLFAHAVFNARLISQEGRSHPSLIALARAQAVAENLENQPVWLRLVSPDDAKAVAHEAYAHWQKLTTKLSSEADSAACEVIPKQDVLQALLAQGLIAARMRDQRSHGQSPAEWYQSIHLLWPKPSLDTALKSLEQTPHPSMHDYRLGIPAIIFERIQRLKSDCPLAMLPDPQCAFDELKPSAQKRLFKKLAGTQLEPRESGGQVPSGGDKQLARHVRYNAGPASEKSPSAGGSFTPEGAYAREQMGDTDATDIDGPASSQPKRRLMGLLPPKKLQHAQISHADIQRSDTPLWEADALYEEDADAGIEAYRMLLHQSPRWALVRFRLGEALVNAGNAEGIEHLMASAEQLPNALPAILDAMSGGLAMLSPLEEEPLRASIQELSVMGPKIAGERETIVVERLYAPNIDDQDAATLRSVCKAANGLSEAWLFSAPAHYLDNVPHHVFIGCASTLNDEALQNLALQIAEHAAIRGTLAVHLERSMPDGTLGALLAANPAFWRPSSVAGLRASAA